MSVKDFDTSSYTRDELLQLVETLTEHLGNSTNVRFELLQHYERCKRIAQDAEALFMEEPKAFGAASNTVTAVLKELSRQEVEVYNAEKAKAMEAAIINTIKEFPEIADSFLERFKANLEDFLHE